MIIFIIKEPYILVFMKKALLILLISCSQDIWLPIIYPGIEYPGMARTPIIMHNFIKTHVNHHVGPVVDKYCSHDGIFVHLCRAIEYILIIGWVTLKTWPLNTLGMLVVLPISFLRYDAKDFLMSLVNQPPPGPLWMNLHRDCATDTILQFLMAELFNMYDVANEPVLDQNV